MTTPEELSCREVVELVTEYLERAMTTREREAFRAHLATCAGCANYLDQIHATMQLTATLGDDPLAPDLRTRLIAAFRGWRRSAEPDQGL